MIRRLLLWMLGGFLLAALAGLPTSGYAAQRPTLAIHPARVALGRPFTILLAGVHPRQTVYFTAQPCHSTGFGGGEMGTYRADAAGRISFTYPAFTHRWEMRRWRIAAFGRGAHPLATTVLVVLPGHAGTVS